MKQRNGAGSKRLVEATHRFIRSEQKLLEVLLSRRILRKADCEHFARDLDVSASKKRSSDVFGSAIAINKKLMGVLAGGKGTARGVTVSAIDVLHDGRGLPRLHREYPRWPDTSAVRWLVLAMWAGGLLLSLVPSLPVIVVALAVCATCGFLCQTMSTSFVAVSADAGHSSAVGLYVTFYSVFD